MSYVTDYIYRNRKGAKTKVGMLFGTCIDGEIRIGHSLCCSTDEFDEDVAFALAGIRAISPEADPIPPSIVDDVMAFASILIDLYPDGELVLEDENFGFLWIDYDKEWDEIFEAYEEPVLTVDDVLVEIG